MRLRDPKRIHVHYLGIEFASALLMNEAVCSTLRYIVYHCNSTSVSRLMERMQLRHSLYDERALRSHTALATRLEFSGSLTGPSSLKPKPWQDATPVEDPSIADFVATKYPSFEQPSQQ